MASSCLPPFKSLSALPVSPNLCLWSFLLGLQIFPLVLRGQSTEDRWPSFFFFLIIRKCLSLSCLKDMFTVVKHFFLLRLQICHS